MVGHAYTASGSGYRQEAVIWRDSVVAKLAPPVAGAQTWAQAIDNSGRVAVSYAAPNWVPARWAPDVPNGTTGTMIALSPAGQAKDINNAGVICGYDGYDPVIWDGLTADYLDGMYWGQSSATGINDAGAAVGSTFDGDTWVFTAWIWDSQNRMRDLNLFLTSSTAYASPGTLAESRAINGSGQVLVYTSGGYFVLLTPSLQPPQPQLPAPPSVYSSAGDGVVMLSWNAVYFAASYNVKRSTVSGGPYTTIASDVPDLAFADTSVVNGTRYYYVVSSVNGSYESANSLEVTAKPLAAPFAPTSLTATILNRGKAVQLGWKQSTSPEIRWNKVYRSTNGGAYAQIAQISAGTSYQDSQVSRRTTYSYVVTAINVNGQESPASNVVVVRLK